VEQRVKDGSRFDSRDNRSSNGITTVLTGRTNFGYSESKRAEVISQGIHSTLSLHKCCVFRMFLFVTLQ
jgi:hypothetical protein